jgi:very-short-patch-repair endonuclease
LRARGFTVLRFWNYQVISEIDEVIQQIADALGESDGTRKRKM